MTMIIHKSSLPNIDIDQSSFVYEGDFILIQDEYISGLLKLVGVPEINDDEFYEICSRGYFNNYPEFLEKYALKSADNSYMYALHAIKGKFKIGEPIIAADVYYSYWYAFDVLECRFELGEPAIATVAKCSYRYARDVLEGRFELGEPAIATDARYSYGYARDVLEGRFELGEQLIINSEYANLYREKFWLSLMKDKIVRTIKHLWRGIL